jgi:hypothetical protein
VSDTTDGNAPQSCWIWPSVGSAAVSYGLDSEIFDTEKFPHIETFVRETIQNSLDARLNKDQPVIVRFAFHEEEFGKRERYLSDLKQMRGSCNLPWPEVTGAQSKLRWLVVEDSNTTGLKGALDDRSSDFWNYWLNFGISNKDGSGRGGRGIGRITFLIASQIHAVIGVTRRQQDGKVVACGMSMLRPGPQGAGYKSSYAYLVPAIKEPIFDLHGEAIVQKLTKLFKLHDYQSNQDTGLSLIVPFPHDALTEEGICVAAIEHFAPAIISGKIKVVVGNTNIDAQTIDNTASALASKFPQRGAFSKNPVRVLQLIRSVSGDVDWKHELKSIPNKPLPEVVDEKERELQRKKFEASGKLSFAIRVPLTNRKILSYSWLKGVVAATPDDGTACDFFFREGMALPEVLSKHPANIDLILLADDGDLVRYLNYCEGKAHLDLYENNEVKAKLRDKGFSDGVAPKRFVKNLMQGLRTLVLPDTTKPDAKAFSSFFSTKRFEERMGQSKKSKTTRVIDNVGELKPRVRPFLIESLTDGFRVKSNKDFSSWPVNLKLDVAYSDGSAKPAWSKHDFEFAKLKISQPAGLATTVNKNTLKIQNCQSNFEMQISGFDTRRELIVRATGTRNA